MAHLESVPSPAPRTRKPRALKPEGAIAPRPTLKVSAASKRSVHQVMASIAAGFLPVASFVIAHFEAKADPLAWGLVAAALAFSATTLAQWARRWSGSDVKSWGFTILLEGVLVYSSTLWLSATALAILVVINSAYAYEQAARRE